MALLENWIPDGTAERGYHTFFNVAYVPFSVENIWERISVCGN